MEKVVVLGSPLQRGDVEQQTRGMGERNGDGIGRLIARKVTGEIRWNGMYRLKMSSTSDWAGKTPPPIMQRLEAWNP